MQILYNYNIRTGYSKNKPKFTGHSGFEKLPFYVGLTKGVTTETRLFRDFETIDFATKYIKSVFKNTQKNIVVGACSTGEEVYSIKMLMHGESYNITGFDIGKNTIKQAKSGIIELNIPTDKNSEYYTKFIDMDTYKDSFLAKDDENISKKQQFLKEIFSKTFEKTEIKTKLMYRVSERLRKIFDIAFVEFDKQHFKCKEKDENCKFIQGNIEELDKIISQEQCVHLFSFKNALYHLITDNDNYHRESISHQRVKIILDKIFKDINKTLHKEGLFIMGETENKQHMNMHFVSKGLLENGFVPIRMRNRPYLNIWKKVKEVE